MLHETAPLKLGRERAQERASFDVQRFVQNLGQGNPSTAAALARLATENSRDAHRLATRGAWNRLEQDLAEVGSRVVVDVRPLWQAGGEELQRAGMNFRPGLRRMARLIQQEGTDVPEQAVRFPPISMPGGGPPSFATPSQGAVTYTREPFLGFDEAQDLR
jgi:hypothetical protein